MNQVGTFRTLPIDNKTGIWISGLIPANVFYMQSGSINKNNSPGIAVIR